MREFADFKEVARDPRHDPAGLVVVVKTEGQFFQMREQVPAHAGLHADADHVPVILDEIPEAETDDVQGQDDGPGNHDRPVLPVRNVIVQHPVRHDGVDHSGRGDQKCRAKIQRQHLPVRTVIGDETS